MRIAFVGDGNRVGPVALDRPPSVVTYWGSPKSGPGMNLPYGVGGDHRDVVDVGVDELEAEQGRRLGLDHRPGGQAAVGRAEELAGRDRPAGGVVDVLAQEDLVRRMRRVGLALVDERGVGVRARCASAPSGPVTIVPRVRTMNRWLGGRSSPLPRMWSGPAISGSSALSGTNTVPLPPLVILSRPWSKNWPKIVNSELNGGERPTSVVTFGMSRVSCAGTQPTGAVATAGADRARDDALVALGPDGEAGGGDRGRVRRGLVDDQVADRARLGVERRCRSSARTTSRPAAAERGRRASASTEHRGGQARERLVGGAEGLLAGTGGCCRSRRRSAGRTRAAGSRSGPGP